MDMISSDSSAAASAQHHNHQEQHQHQKEAMSTAVASPQTEEGRNGKQARQQQAVVAAAASGGGGGERKPRPAQDHALKCPRCDSTNTKFCYYNNYSMSQPRYFCKACRRYWTQGGSLRNVPVGGGCRKNKRSSGSSSSASASSGSSGTSSNINSTLVPGQPMVPPSTTDFPNVLPTFMSAGFELPSDHHLSLPFAPLSLSNPPPSLAPGVGTTTSSFMDILRGGFLDGTSSNHHQISNGFYGPTTGGGNGMVMPMPMPPPFGFGVMQHQHGMGGHAASAIGGGATAATQGGQWPTTVQHGNNNGDVASGSAGLQVGDGAHQPGSSNDNVMMDSNNNSGSSSREYCYWNNSNGSAAAAANNPWQAGGLINSGSLI